MRAGTRNAERRLSRLLQSERILLVRVAAHARNDRGIPQYVTNSEGATVGNREFHALIRQIVVAARGVS